MKKFFITILFLGCLNLISCNKNVESSHKVHTHEEKNNDIKFKFILSNIENIRNGEEVINFNKMKFLYHFENEVLKCKEYNLFEKEKEFIVKSNQPLILTNNSFYVYYNNDTSQLWDDLILGFNDSAPVDFGILGKWVQMTDNLWYSFPQNSPCDLGYNHKTQKTRVYLPGSTYEVKFYIMETNKYFSLGNPETTKQYPFPVQARWLMCDITKK